MILYNYYHIIRWEAKTCYRGTTVMRSVTDPVKMSRMFRLNLTVVGKTLISVHFHRTVELELQSKHRLSPDTQVCN